MSLLTELRDTGLDVIEYPGWETLTNNDRDRTETVGIVNHWDAIKGWPGVHKYVSKNRFGGLLYHIVVRQDGIVALLSQRYAWHAGQGDKRVLWALQDQKLPPNPADTSNTDRVNGNPHFFGVCINYHPDEGAIKPAQYDALVKVNAVLLRHFDLNTNQIIDHDHWTTRKWDIRTMDLAQFREDVSKQMDNITRRLLLDLVFELFPNVQGDRTYWYDLPEDSPEWDNLFNAVRVGAQDLKRETDRALSSATSAHNRITKIHDATA